MVTERHRHGQEDSPAESNLENPKRSVFTLDTRLHLTLIQST